MNALNSKQINFKTFSAKIKVEYEDSKESNLTLLHTCEY
jgi:hypothetical protein